MDYKIKGDFMFQLLKLTIVAENHKLLELVAKKYNKDYDNLKEKYIRPEFYLPLVIEDGPKDKKPAS